MEANRKCDVFSLGPLDYRKAWDLQRNLVEKRAEKKINDTLLLVEHQSLFTIGRKGSRKNILVSDKHLEEKGIPVHEVDRGGDITYHGPGQVIGYPILDLNSHGRDVHLMLRNLEEVIIRLLSDYGVEGSRIPGCTGVWVGEEKIAAIGIGVRRWITFHGFCLNVNPDMNYFSMINPCGIKGRGVTSLEKLRVNECSSAPVLQSKRLLKERKENIDKKGLEGKLVEHFGEVFNLDMGYANNPGEMINGK